MANKLWLVESFYFELRLVFINNYPKDLCFISLMRELNNLVFKYRKHLHKSCRMCLKPNIEDIIYIQEYKQMRSLFFFYEQANVQRNYD